MAKWHTPEGRAERERDHEKMRLRFAGLRLKPKKLPPLCDCGNAKTRAAKRCGECRNTERLRKRGVSVRKQRQKMKPSPSIRDLKPPKKVLVVRTIRQKPRIKIEVMEAQEINLSNLAAVIMRKPSRKSL